jgi:hypothetical protein
MPLSAYKQIKIVGFVLFIPVVLGVGPLTGYFLGDYLVKKFSLGFYVMPICVTLGFLAALEQTIKILKLVTKIEGGPDNS